jgi:magnesium-transporting ATPase (P-type)
MFIVFLGAVVTKKSPLNAVQMLWVNLIMDTFAALALATEPPPKNILKRASLKKDDPIITKVMGRNVQGHAIYQCIILLVILFAGPTFLLDYQYETQCVEYIKNNSTGELECNTHKLNPFYTKTEYYDPLLWKPIVEKSQPDLY